MGCRPSKQATSKVRAVEHKEDPKCLCSPKKVRKPHKCSSSDNSSRKASGGSRSEGKKQHSFSTGPRPRSAKSADLDFPAFSTTTAVYRKSASKTSKITLRLSCDGSTLEIEQCDYDLEKVRGESESKPRPWSSAPNLTKLRDSKARLFRDSYVPMKHSASAWSPSVTSTASGSRGAQIRVPVLINTPEEHHSTASHLGSSSSQDQGSTSGMLECQTYSSKGSIKPLSSKSGPASGSFSQADEREPLLGDAEKERFPARTFRENNINKAFDFKGSKEGLRASSTLDNMIDRLEYSLELTSHVTHSSGPVNRRPRSLEANQGHSEKKSNRRELSPPRTLTQKTRWEAYSAGVSPDFEQIPVNVISSFIARPSSGNATEIDSNHNPIVTASDIYHLDNQAQGRHLDRQDSRGQMASPIHNQHLRMQHLTNGPPDFKLAGSDRIIQKSPADAFLDTFTGKKTGPKSYEIPDSISHVNHRSPSFSAPIDSDGVLTFVTLGCPVPNEMPGFMYASEDESPLSLFTPQHHLRYPYQEIYTDRLENSVLQSILGNRGNIEYDVASDDCELCREYEVTGLSDVDSPLDNLTQLVIDYSEPDRVRQHAEFRLPTKVFMGNNCDDLAHNSPLDEQNNGRAIAVSQMKDGEREEVEGKKEGTGQCIEQEHELGTRDVSLMEVMGETVGENYIPSVSSGHHRKEGGGTLLGDVGSASSRSVKAGLLHQAQRASSCDGEMSDMKVDALQGAPDEIGNRLVSQNRDNIRSVKVNDALIHTESDANCHIRDNGFDAGNGGVILHKHNSQSQSIPTGLGYNNRPSFSIDNYDRVSVNDVDTGKSKENTPSVRILGKAEDQNEATLHQEFYRGETDLELVSEKADYLVELLYTQDGQLHVSSDSAKTQFSYDLDDLERGGLCFSSFSDASDNDVSPLYYRVPDQSCQPAEDGNRHRQRGVRQETSQTGLTSMQEGILTKNLTGVDLALYQQDMDAFIKNTTHQIMAHSSVTGGGEKAGIGPAPLKASTTCLKGSAERAEANDVSPLADESRRVNAREVENVIMCVPSVAHKKTWAEEKDNGQENKRATILLRADILAKNITAARSKRANDSKEALWSCGESKVCRSADTEGDMCKNRSDPVSTRSIADVNTFPNHHASTAGASTSKNPSGFDSSLRTWTTRQIRVDSEGGRVLIDALTSGHRRPGENSEGPQNECVIDPRDRTHLNPDEIPNTALTPLCQVNGTHDAALEKPISDFSSNDIAGTDSGGFVNEICPFSNGFPSYQNQPAGTVSSVRGLKCFPVQTSRGDASARKDSNAIRVESSSPAKQFSRAQNQRQNNHLDSSRTLDCDSFVTLKQQSRAQSDVTREGSTSYVRSSDVFLETQSKDSTENIESVNTLERLTKSENVNGFAQVEPSPLVSFPLIPDVSLECNSSVLTENGNISSDGELSSNGSVRLKSSASIICSNDSQQNSKCIVDSFSKSRRTVTKSASKDVADRTKYRAASEKLESRSSHFSKASDLIAESVPQDSMKTGSHLLENSTSIPSAAEHPRENKEKNIAATSSTDGSLALSPRDNLAPGTGDLMNEKRAQIDPVGDEAMKRSTAEQGNEQLEISRRIRRRNNVLSLVQYFETVPYTRSDPKQ